MSSTKPLNTILNGLYICIALLFMFDILTNFEISSQGLKSFVYYGVLFATPLILIWNLIGSKNNKVLASLSPLLILILVFTIGLTKILANVNAWQTQVILYKNKNSNLSTIEHQRQSNDAFKFNERTVSVTHLTGLFMIVYQIPVDIAAKSEWIKVNQYVNDKN
jgi:hypothetical protein